ncbi:hypothetical protein, partial [Acinetobacter ursingii]|uniref:hypothetical protein n=1 Tax=Acinetobacter ursingii TaxID=108980 RepID=UPI001C08C958
EALPKSLASLMSNPITTRKPKNNGGYGGNNQGYGQNNGYGQGFYMGNLTHDLPPQSATSFLV